VAGLLHCVTVYISVFDVCLLRTGMLCLWKVIGLLWECSVAGLFYCVAVYISVLGCVCYVQQCCVYGM
jgi:hypothetical protein